MQRIAAVLALSLSGCYLYFEEPAAGGAGEVDGSDDYGNYFISHPPGEVLGDGSIRFSYTLPADGHFNFEIGWYCDAANDGPVVPLAGVRIHTLPDP